MHWLAIVSSFAVAATVATGAAATSRHKAAAEVEATDRQFNRALEQSDVAALRELIADTYLFTDPAGRLSDKQNVIEGFASRRIRIKSQTTRDVRIEVYADAAVETGVLTSVAIRDGRNTSGTFRFTRVWVKLGGHWRTVAFQETAPQTEAPPTRRVPGPHWRL
jgi:ketosteroid isomerase-like protein